MPSIFSQIIARQIPAEIIHETEHCIAFLDIAPDEYGHTLVVPKIEVAAFDALPAACLHDLIDTMQLLTKAIMQAMDTPHYNLVLNNGKAARQEVLHVHFHIIPRYEGVRRKKGPYPEGMAAHTAQQLRAALVE